MSWSLRIKKASARCDGYRTGYFILSYDAKLLFWGTKLAKIGQNWSKSDEVKGQRISEANSKWSALIILIWLILDPWMLNQEKDLLVFWKKWEQEKLRLKLSDLKNPMWNAYGSKYLVTHHFENCHDVIWNILVKAQCNSTTESNEFPKLCSYCWIPKNEAMLEIGNAPSFGGVHQSSYGGEYKLKKICTYRPPESCNTWSLVKGTCSDCSWNPIFIKMNMSCF